MRYFIFFILCFLSAPSLAQTKNTPRLDASDKLELQAKKIGQQLRCVVCQNQSIEDSPSDLASDMRRLVRKRLAAGDTEDEVIAYIHNRYGDYVLLKPPVQKNTYILWFAPFLLLLFAFVFYWRRAMLKPNQVDELSQQEKQQLADIEKSIVQGNEQ